MKVLFIHRKDPSNLGDMTCSPIQYLIPEPSDTRIELDLSDKACEQRADCVVIGGGGLFHTGFDKTMDLLVKLHRTRNTPVVIWGIGTNYHSCKEAKYPRWHEQAQAVAIRDKPSAHQFAYCPCVSCLHPAFDHARSIQPRMRMVIYKHWMSKVLDQFSYPMLTNNGSDLSLALTHLSSGQIVLTNSYHGAYWSLLLGRPVIIHDPFASRFFWGLPVDCVTCKTNPEDAAEAAMAEKIPDRLLEDCRALNRRFAAAATSIAGVNLMIQ